MKIAVCDDNPKHINAIENSLFEIGKAENIKVECDAYQSGEELTRVYQSSTAAYDVIFLDMEMDGLNGIDTANLIRERDEYVIIVFVTSHTEYMKDSFKCSPFRFLVKPVHIDELKEVFSDILKKLSKKKKVLSFTENKALIRIYCEDIIYCESLDHWVYIHTTHGTHKICKSLSDLYGSLDDTLLFRVHSSFIVNFHYVKAIRNNFIELYHSDKDIPISRSYKKSVLFEYTNYIERNLYV